jgi:hypothetical protein
VPYVNQYDATASLLDDFFTEKPNYKPYKLVYPSKEIFNTTNAMKRYNRDIDWKKIEKVQIWTMKMKLEKRIIKRKEIKFVCSYSC